MKELCEVQEFRRMYHKYNKGANRVTVSQRVNDYDDLQYIGNITIEYCSYLCDDYCCASGSKSSSDSDGNPDDSGDDYFYAKGARVGKKVRKGDDNGDVTCLTKQRFNSSASSTYIADGKNFTIHYGLGFADGFQGQDTLRIGAAGETQLVIPNVTFGQATTISKDMNGDAADGILGLAFRYIAVNHVEPPLIAANRLGLLDKPLFTVYLDTEGVNFTNSRGGLFTYGGLDSENCASDVNYVNLTSAHWWQFNIESVNVGKQYTYTKDAAVISDTGTSLIFGPPKIVKKIAKAVGQQYL
ncbi:eukaryotic aspartyl protease domain-containing protein [Ditylenchus destructor]|nr:eukaryotic aspartyl protease domain-containing protein [Ditylenchus destructor]